MTRRARLLDWLIDTRLNRWSIWLEDALDEAFAWLLRRLVGPTDRSTR